jgi:hypothetical protein
MTTSQIKSQIRFYGYMGQIKAPCDIHNRRDVLALYHQKMAAYWMASKILRRSEKAGDVFQDIARPEFNNAASLIADSFNNENVRNFMPAKYYPEGAEPAQYVIAIVDQKSPKVKAFFGAFFGVFAVFSGIIAMNFIPALKQYAGSADYWVAVAAGGIMTVASGISTFMVGRSVSRRENLLREATEITIADEAGLALQADQPAET